MVDFLTKIPFVFVAVLGATLTLTMTATGLYRVHVPVCSQSGLVSFAELCEQLHDDGDGSDSGDGV